MKIKPLLIATVVTLTIIALGWGALHLFINNILSID